MTPEQRQRAGRAVSARMSELGLTAAFVQREAPVDNKTLQSLVEGRRWPNPATRGRVEAALHWEPGEIERLALGEAIAPSPARPAEHLTNSQLIAELAMRLGEAAATTKEEIGDERSATPTKEAGRAGQESDNVHLLHDPPTEYFQELLDQKKAAAERDKGKGRPT